LEDELHQFISEQVLVTGSFEHSIATSGSKGSGAG
jgi:hypothetical protein